MDKGTSLMMLRHQTKIASTKTMQTLKKSLRLTPLCSIPSSNQAGSFQGDRVVFDASAIASLKAKETSPSVQNPTRVEVVSSLLWKCMMAAFKATSGIHMPTFITHAVNFR
jgi:hypothetical protein